MNNQIVKAQVSRLNNQNEELNVPPPVLLIHQENSYRDVMTEEEVIEYLRIPYVSQAGNYKHVIDNLIRMRDLPCIHICRKRLFPLSMVREWVAGQQIKGVA